MGMSARQRLLSVELPLALPLILEGMRLSLVINVGTATIGSTVAAKGLGEVIIAGLLSNNNAFILQGGLVTGLMAILLYDALAGIEGASAATYTSTETRFARAARRPPGPASAGPGDGQECALRISRRCWWQTRRPAHAIQAVPNRLARSKGLRIIAPRREGRLAFVSGHDRHVLTDIVTGAHRAIRSSS